MTKQIETVFEEIQRRLAPEETREEPVKRGRELELVKVEEEQRKLNDIPQLEKRKILSALSKTIEQETGKDFSIIFREIENRTKRNEISKEMIESIKSDFLQEEKNENNEPEEVELTPLEIEKQASKEKLELSNKEWNSVLKEQSKIRHTQFKNKRKRL